MCSTNKSLDRQRASVGISAIDIKSCTCFNRSLFRPYLDSYAGKILEFRRPSSMALRDKSSTSADGATGGDIGVVCWLSPSVAVDCLLMTVVATFTTLVVASSAGGAIRP